MVGSQRSIDAMTTRPIVTIAQNVVRASDATVVDAPSSLVMSICDQLPFIVSQMPYSTANAAYSQNRAGTAAFGASLAVAVAAAARAPVRSGSRRLMSSSPARRMDDSTGRPHQNPRPTKTATNTGASAVPSPRSALSARTERSTAAGWNTAVNVLRLGTVSPNPVPSAAVATRSNP